METPVTPPYEIKKFDLSFLTNECMSSIPSPPEFTEDCTTHKRKSIPHRSPSSMDDKSIIFQLSSSLVPKILHGTSILWPLRQRVSKARTVKRVKAVKIQIPRPVLHETDLVLPTKPVLIQSTPPVRPRKYSQPHSGRPSRIKGPCQACRETSDGCMRKAFNWPFPTDTEFSDKGKPFVYLCNKCGLRYNKSGGCVCRHCRWVLCKEEKRKAMQLIDSMRRFKPDGKIEPEDDIESFVCNPKYWPCGHTWKVGWVLHSQDVDADEDSSSSDDNTL
ncbi:hypothetical protein G6F46_009082 [Rhizopus delemar]|uniref:Uncharacterized protein n=3 Tax=Rhizopus TaxID=4842 RepID=I1CK54_RHIO9|nr:hypothetical protein RO3G_13545 [Rhizopus delemar RA 99-880]KAG1048377.1 hypothetical protein G6F43_009226 [Rhizopus delemar]KAG1532981.1 hypothetical protein G6F51_012843 [Rhizopus arrhizus]KAG1443791.1 hypothetical protein G6F55_012548 [Rhizopus delemar]KAG1487561.1 hypothetical protein G6F54_012582 [Rhizopus delemar]|eukprot:EIE88834.1 hypothetical protein RO3G_13545 [Rhizopus delemar RA 99-880]